MVKWNGYFSRRRLSERTATYGAGGSGWKPLHNSFVIKTRSLIGCGTESCLPLKQMWLTPGTKRHSVTNMYLIYWKKLSRIVAMKSRSWAHDHVINDYFVHIIQNISHSTRICFAHSFSPRKLTLVGTKLGREKNKIFLRRVVYTMIGIEIIIISMQVTALRNLVYLIISLAFQEKLYMVFHNHPPKLINKIIGGHWTKTLIFPFFLHDGHHPPVFTTSQ